MTDAIPHLFILRRDRDVTGVSGPGDIADGVQWVDGTVVLRWRERPSTSVWDSVDLMLSVHGHDGATRIVWDDDEQSRRNFLTTVAAAYDVPAALLGTEAERAHLHQQISRALHDAAFEVRREYKPMDGFGSVPYPPEVKGYLTELTDAVMPIVGQLQERRDHAQRTVGAAYRLADNWQAAHGTSTLLVRAAGAELRDVLDGELEDDHDWYHPTPLSGLVCRRCDLAHKFWSGESCIAAEPEAPPPAAECSAQYTRFSNDWRQCIRAAQHRGDHIDDRGFHWSDTVAVYPVLDGKLKCGRAAASSCSKPDHACKVCGDCMYEHPGEGGCAGVRLHERTATRTEGSLEELADAVRTVLGIDVRTVPTDLNTWLLTACRQLEKSEDAREHLRGQRNAIAQALREVLAAFHPVTTDRHGEVIVYEALRGIHPSNFNRWRKTLDGIPANCKKPGGCPDCPHKTET